MKTLLIIFFCLLSCAAFSDQFVVTDNGDAGTGTLRDALTKAAANGTAEPDFIYFNLPGTSVAAHTISIINSLPPITANVTIDGTTQPGAAFGVSNAKVIITGEKATSNINGLNIANVKKDDIVNIYGLCIRNFNHGNFTDAISVGGDCKLTVGAPGKGNVIINCSTAIYGAVTNVTVQSNFLGIEPDGITQAPNGAIMSSANGFGTLLVGGDLPEDGNVIIGGLNISLGDEITIKNNLFGTDYTGTKVIGSYNNPFILIKSQVTSTVIEKNVFSTGFTAINALDNVALTITGNFFGIDRTQSYPLKGTGDSRSAISISTKVTALIGGDAEADQNVFANYDNPLESFDNSKIEVLKNKFTCNSYVFIPSYDGNFIHILNITDNQVSGDAPPGAKVQLYYSTTQCGGFCNPDAWFATVTANADGKWVYDGELHYPVMASSTLNHNTTGFDPYIITAEDVIQTNVNCDHLGSIELKDKRTGKFTYMWKKDNTILPNNTYKIENLQPGFYELSVNENGSCPKALGEFMILDMRPQATPPAGPVKLDCNKATATLTAAYVAPAEPVSVKWTLPGGAFFSDQKQIEVAAGVYYLTVTDANGCASAPAKYEVLKPDNSPDIDSTAVVCTDANCSQPNGSITGMKVPGFTPVDYGWKRKDGTITAPNQFDLKNAPAGEYYFYVTYKNGCVPLQTNTYKILAKDGITLDESGATPYNAKCGGEGGGVTGIKATGATNYKWTDQDGNIKGTELDLKDVPPGKYTLHASNAICGTIDSKTAYTVDKDLPAGLPTTYKIDEHDAYCGQNNGSLKIAFDNLVKSCRWVNQITGAQYSTPEITDLDAGTYKLYLTDQGNCEGVYGDSYTINRIPPPKITAGSETMVPDGCGLKTGSISTIKITGGKEPYTYSWVSADGLSYGDKLDVSNLTAGSYTLHVTDALDCTDEHTYPVTNVNADVAAPLVNDLDVCAPGQILLAVSNPVSAYTYKLYTDDTSVDALQQSSAGRFTVNVKGSSSYYISQLNGTCESPRAKVNVKVVSTSINVSNTFTPNGDGFNDTWEIKGLDVYPKVNIKLFGRYGQEVYESTGYGKPFDGGRLPAGVYYYIINLQPGCNLLSGSLTLIR